MQSAHLSQPRVVVVDTWTCLLGGGGGLGIQTRVLTLAQQALQQFSSPPAPALPAPTAHRFCSGTCLFLSLHQVGLQTHATMPGFYVGAGDLNRGLNDCAARSKLAD